MNEWNKLTLSEKAQVITEMKEYLDSFPFKDGCIAIHPDDLKTLPTSPAVYQISGNDCLYIGSTGNLNMRFCNGHHALQRILIDGLTKSLFDDGGALALTWDDCSGLDRHKRRVSELAYIKEFKPIYNIQ